MNAAEGSIVVNAAVADVYERWLVFEDYPKFITAIKRVRKLDENHFSRVAVIQRKAAWSDTWGDAARGRSEDSPGELQPVNALLIILPLEWFLSRHFLTTAHAWPWNWHRASVVLSRIRSAITCTTSNC
jgi:hypothetical protein